MKRLLLSIRLLTVALFMVYTLIFTAITITLNFKCTHCDKLLVKLILILDIPCKYFKMGILPSDRFIRYLESKQNMRGSKISKLVVVFIITGFVLQIMLLTELNLQWL